jgi:hypothetical protein
MINKAELALSGASPAPTRSFDTHHSIGREMRARQAGVHRTRRNGLNAYVSEPRPQSDVDSNSPSSMGISISGRSTLWRSPE